MMNTTDQDWNNLMDEWQQSVPYPNASRMNKDNENRHLKTISEKVIKDGKSERLGTLFAASISLILSGFLFNEIRTGLPSMFDYAFYFTMMILILMTGISVVWHQRSAWKVNAEQTTQYLELMLKQNRAASNVSKAGEVFGYGLLISVYGIVLWIFLPSLLNGTLMADLSSVAKPVLGSGILLAATLVGLSAIILNRKFQRSLTEKADLLTLFLKELKSND